jgi:hypothetical protein
MQSANTKHKLSPNSQQLNSSKNALLQTLHKKLETAMRSVELGLRGPTNLFLMILRYRQN